MYDQIGFPRPAYAAVKLAIFLVVLTVLVLGLPALAGLAIFGIAS